MRDMICVDISKFKNYLICKEMSYKVRLHRVCDQLKRTLRSEVFPCRMLRSFKLYRQFLSWGGECCAVKSVSKLANEKPCPPLAPAISCHWHYILELYCPLLCYSYDTGMDVLA